MRRTADSIEEGKLSENSEHVSEARKRSLANLKPFRPGQSGNPGGRPKDKAREIAQKIFDDNEEAVYTALGKSLLKGNFYGFATLADRAYGKLKETKEVHVTDDIANSDLDRRITGLLEDLGLVGDIDEASRIAKLAGDKGGKTVQG